MKWLIIILTVLLIVLFGFGFYMARFSVTGVRQTIDEAVKRQNELGDIHWFDGYETVEYTVKSYDDYILHVRYLKNNKVDTDKYVLISHGYTDNRIGALKYADTYLDLGFNVIVYDLRGHGLNEKTFCSYSVREAKDLEILIKDSRERYPDARIFGIHGESLGAATSIMVLKYKPQIDFVVADCGFSNITEVLKGGLRMMHIPDWFVYIASLCTKIRYGYFYGDMKPINALSDNEIPILFIHGAADSFIVPSHSERMAKATKGYSEVHLMPDAEHAVSVFRDKAKYKGFIENFLNTINVK